VRVARLGLDGDADGLKVNVIAGGIRWAA
jgi:hypothetical protein